MNAASFYRRAFELMSASEGGTWQADGSPAEAPIGPSADELEAAGPALEEMHRGAAVAQCDWGLPLSNAGFTQTITLHTQVRQLVQLSTLRAGIAFQEGRDRDAFADLLAVLAFARHLGMIGFYVSGLVQFGVEAIAIAAAAPFVPRLNQETVNEAMARLEAMPSSITLADAVRAEKVYFLDSSHDEFATAPPAELPRRLRDLYQPAEAEAILTLTGGDQQRLLRLVTATADPFDELAEIYTLSFDQMAPALVAFQAAHEATNPLAVAIMRQSERMRPGWERATATRELFRAAITCIASGHDASPAHRQARGIEQLATVPDPFGTGPFAYRPMPGGFELASRYQALTWDGGQMVLGPVRLRLGPSE